jgi:hypothetical protein
MAQSSMTYSSKNIQSLKQVDSKAEEEGKGKYHTGS